MNLAEAVKRAAQRRAMSTQGATNTCTMILFAVCSDLDAAAHCVGAMILETGYAVGAQHGQPAPVHVAYWLSRHAMRTDAEITASRLWISMCNAIEIGNEARAVELAAEALLTLTSCSQMTPDAVERACVEVLERFGGQ